MSGKNSFSQTLTGLPAPSVRELWRRGEAFRTAKASLLEGGVTEGDGRSLGEPPISKG